MKLVRLLAAGSIAAATLIAVPAHAAVLTPEEQAALQECLGLPEWTAEDDAIVATFDAVVIGTDGDDKLRGTAGNDLICGGEGDDTLWGYAGDDQLYSDDVAFFGNLGAVGGDDTVFGGDGNDELLTGAGDDTAFGGAGDDSLPLALGDDKGFGGAGDDFIVGGYGTDILNGENGNDFVAGGFNDDIVYGGNGDDALFGELPGGQPAPPQFPAPVADGDKCIGAGGVDTAVQCDTESGTENVPA